MKNGLRIGGRTTDSIRMKSRGPRIRQARMIAGSGHDQNAAVEHSFVPVLSRAAEGGERKRDHQATVHLPREKVG